MDMSYKKNHLLTEIGELLCFTIHAFRIFRMLSVIKQPIGKDWLTILSYHTIHNP